jgi:hypothetical protein
MKFGEALEELRKDPDHSRMERPHWHSGTGYVVYNSGLHFINGHEVTQECPLILPTDYLAEDWIVKTTYHTGVEALEAYNQDKWISHKDWNGGYYNISHSRKGSGCLCYTTDILRQLSEDLWLIKDSI